MSASISASKLAESGVYRAVIPKGAVLDNSRTLEGAYKASYRVVPNRIAGHADWISETKSVNQLKITSTVNAVAGIASMVVGQYYIAQINSQIGRINKGISSIQQHLDDEYYSKVMQLAMDVKNISEFKWEIFDDANEKESKTYRLCRMGTM